MEAFGQSVRLVPHYRRRDITHCIHCVRIPSSSLSQSGFFTEPIEDTMVIAEAANLTVTKLEGPVLPFFVVYSLQPGIQPSCSMGHILHDVPPRCHYFKR